MRPWPISVLHQDAPQVSREVRHRGDAVAEQELSVLVDRLEDFLCGLLNRVGDTDGPSEGLSHGLEEGHRVVFLVWSLLIK